MELSRPTLDDDEERATFEEAVRQRIEQKEYPTCDPSIAQDVLLTLFVAEEASNRGYPDYASRLREIALDPLEAGQTVLEAAERGEVDTIDDKTPELRSWIDTTRLWRETITAFERDEDGGIQRVGDIANRVVTASDYETAAEALEAFHEYLAADAEEAIPNESSSETHARLRTAEASPEEVVTYNGLLMLLHRRHMGAEFSDIELRGP